MDVPPTSPHGRDHAIRRRWRAIGARRHAFVLALVAAGSLAAWWLVPHGLDGERDLAPATAPAADVAVAPTARPEEPGARIELHGRLRFVEDGVEFNESPAYVEVVRALRHESASAFAARPSLQFDRDGSLRDPAAWRGLVVRARGLVAVSWAERVRDARAGTSDVWRGVLTNTDGSDGVVFDLVEAPPGFEPRRDLVEIDGVFLRTVRFVNHRDEAQLVPYLLARSLRVVDDAARDAPHDLALGTGVLPLLVLAMGAVWFVYRMATLPRAARRTFRIDAWLPGRRRRRTQRHRPVGSSSDGDL